MAVKRFTLSGSAGNDFRSISEPDTRNQWIYTWDGLGGTDTLGFDRLQQSEFTIYKSADGQVHVDSVSNASHEVYVTLKNVEKLNFNYGTQVVNLLTYFGPPPNSSPTGAVTITGTASQGTTLSAAHSIVDADGIAGAISWLWKANGVAIAGATTNTFKPTQLQVGKVLTVTASYTDQLGTAESVTSVATAPVANVNDAPTGLPQVSGIAGKGRVLQATAEIDDPDGIATPLSTAFAWQWLANGEAIAGATSASFSPGAAEVGKALSVQITYRDLGGTTETLTSSATNPVASTMLSGRVSYWMDNRPMPAVEIDVSREGPSGSPILLAEDTSTADGGWSVAGLDFDRLVVAARASPAVSGDLRAITSTDVLISLKLVSGRPLPAETTGSLNSWRRFAADVDRDGSLTPNDAQQILQQAVNDPSAPSAEFLFLPAATDPESVMAGQQPAQISQALLPAARLESNWIGVLLGDLDGSWQPAL